ncbi:hypothetical protein AWC38_SpisGene24778 [Stylophora pistillata]|uniref:Uncharacterized protein n=1 Tax=Stylophora pistillata TaxID=50429 RepID=A0A2B4QZ23_STYPI|nr:hypothetical protein AWC38_SpisGene24778 [Stylophora pistillata]
MRADISKKFVEGRLAHNLTPAQLSNDLSYIMSSNGQFSDEDDITGKPITDQLVLYPTNPRTKPFDLSLDTSKGYYSSRFGVNMYSADKAEYTVVCEMCWQSSKVDSSSVTLTATSSVETISTQRSNRFENHIVALIHMTKWSNATPNYLMFDVVIKNKSGQSYDQKLPIWVIVYGSKGYHNSIPKSVWTSWYSFESGGVRINSALTLAKQPSVASSAVTKKYVDDIQTSLQTNIDSKATKTALTNATKKIWYRGNCAHNNTSQVSFYVNGTSDHTTNVSQSDNADFTVNKSDNTKLIINNAGEEKIDELKALYKHYHKKWWCSRKIFKNFKRKSLLCKLGSTLLIVIGGIAGGVTMNPIPLATISGTGLLLKTFTDVKKFDRKIDMSKFAFTTYEKILTELRSYLRGRPFDSVSFLNETNIDSKATKTALTNATKKIWYRGNCAHNNTSQVSFYVNGTSDHTTNVSQSDNADFTVNKSDNTKLIINNAGEEKIDELKALYKHYHKKWWCSRKIFKNFKRKSLLCKLGSTLLIVIGGIAGGVTMNPIPLATISGTGLLLKTFTDVKKFDRKIDMSKFAFTTYEKILTELRSYLRGRPFDSVSFLNEVRLIDDTITDLCPIFQSTKVLKQYGIRFESQ